MELIDKLTEIDVLIEKNHKILFNEPSIKTNLRRSVELKLNKIIWVPSNEKEWGFSKQKQGTYELADELSILMYDLLFLIDQASDSEILILKTRLKIE